MNLEKQIYVRKSCRDYLDDELDYAIIDEFMKDVKVLNADVSFRYEILTKNEMNVRTRWSSPYYLALFSEKKENYLENIGFVFQQLSLYLQSEGIGNCWVGLVSLKKKDPDFVIAISFGRSDNMTREMTQFKRKSLSKISDFEDEILIPARLAPSSINSQPWFFRHTNDGFDVFQVKQNILKRKFLKKLNAIDMGIVLAQMYVANPETFEFYIKSGVENIKGYSYVGSIKI